MASSAQRALFSRFLHSQTSLLIGKNARSLTIAVIALVFIIAFVSYVSLRSITEDSIRQALFNQQKQRQIEDIGSLSNHIAADLDNIILRLEMFGLSEALQEGQFTSEESTRLLKETFVEINSIALVDTIGILDSKNILVNTSNEEDAEYLGLDRSQMEYVTQVRKTSKPLVSSGFLGDNGKFYLAISVPIISQRTGEYIGVLWTAIPTTEFFQKYGNVLDLNFQSIIVLDGDGSILVSGLTELVGKDFFGDQVQQLIGHNEGINTLYRNVLSGEPEAAVIRANLGERFSSGYPVYVDDMHVMSVFITTPTASIYSEIDTILLAQKLQTIFLWAGVASVVSLLIVYLYRQNAVLEKKVRRRTQQLEEANSQLETVNEHLRKQDSLQREFINTAAHELKTPVQPILMMTSMLEMDSYQGRDNVTMSKEDLDIIVRNAKRLGRLTEDVLNVARIDSNSLTLNPEEVNLDEIILDAIQDAEKLIEHVKRPVLRIEFICEANFLNQGTPESQNHIVKIRADRGAISEVIANLLNNALKFTDDGTIQVSRKITSSGVAVAVRDSGRGIDPEIMPQLFKKFSTKSERGTGLGLYISKALIEAHCGEIWAKNNDDGRGATFGFTIPFQ